MARFYFIALVLYQPLARSLSVREDEINPRSGRREKPFFDPTHRISRFILFVLDEVDFYFLRSSGASLTTFFVSSDPLFFVFSAQTSSLIRSVAGAAALRPRRTMKYQPLAALTFQ